ncbi:MAG: LPS-assembly protein LptD [Gammaproteobacteria bacterium]|nr:LPS-assembly protein LptD [Gammaproteobacteria bacterium]
MIAPTPPCPRWPLLLSLACAAAVHAADEACPPAADTPLPAPLALSEGAISWSSCHLSIAANGDTELSGDVRVSIGGRQMHCDRLSYIALTQALQLTGSVRYQDQTLRVTGKAGNYGSEGAQFSDAQFELLHGPGRGEAAAVSTRQANVIVLDRVVYTTCPKGQADWELRARRITLDTRRKRGVGHSTRVVFEGVPILYLPWISFPLTSDRQTGLLFPTLGSSSRSGAMLAIPWYWNIAPNQDLTATPTYYSRRGLGLGSEYRLLGNAGDATLRADYLYHDRLTNHDIDPTTADNRSWLRATATRYFGSAWRAQLNAQDVSDIHYFEDFGDGPQATSTTFLPRDLHASMRGDVWQLGAQLLQFQTLDDQLLAADRPYAELPRLSAAARWQGSSGLGSALETELTDFHRDTGPTGWRGHVQPGLSFDYTQPGFYLRPRASWDFTAYRLQDAPTANSTPSRSLPILTLDGALQLERNSGRAGARLVTLEPRVNYVYIPYRDQSMLPVFDSGLPDPNFVSLFRPNRYSGLDRIGDANNLTFGVTTRMLQARTGQQYLSATLGETVHLSQPRVTLPDETADTRRRSDLLANLDLTAYRNWNLHYELAWDPESSRTEKTLIALQYIPSGKQVVNLGYRYTRGSVGQAEASAAWPVGRHWDLYGRRIYSFRDRRPIETFGGVQYRASCWGLRLVLRDSVSSRSGQRDTGWYLQLELKGLSSVGSGADSFLQGSIQGYSPQ